MPTDQRQPILTPDQAMTGMTWLGYLIAAGLIYWAVKESKWFR